MITNNQKNNSFTTIALSTSIPMAMMKPASEVRFNPTPMKDMMSSVPPMVNINELHGSLQNRFCSDIFEDMHSLLLPVFHMLFPAHLPKAVFS